MTCFSRNTSRTWHMAKTETTPARNLFDLESIRDCQSIRFLERNSNIALDLDANWYLRNYLKKENPIFKRKNIMDVLSACPAYFNSSLSFICQNMRSSLFYKIIKI